MSPGEIIATATAAVKQYGFQALILQSGEDSGYSVDELADIVKQIKDKVDVLIGISFGEIGREGLEKLYQVGSRALLMRFETSNPAIYQSLHPGQNLGTRLEHLKQAYGLGYMLMTGSLLGQIGRAHV